MLPISNVGLASFKCIKNTQYKPLKESPRLL